MILFLYYIFDLGLLSFIVQFFDILYGFFFVPDLNFIQLMQNSALVIQLKNK